MNKYVSDEHASIMPLSQTVNKSPEDINLEISKSIVTASDQGSTTHDKMLRKQEIFSLELPNAPVDAQVMMISTAERGDLN